MNFNEHLKRIRLHSKKTQLELANYLCVSAQSVSKWEKGTALPSLEFLPKIADFFNCTINCFFSEYELQIFEQFSVLDEWEMNAILMELLAANSGVKLIKEDTPEEIAPTEPEAEASIPLEALFLPAVYNYLKTHDAMSTSSLQKELKIGYGIAGKILDALCGMGIASKPTKQAPAYIAKEKIDLLLPYIK